MRKWVLLTDPDDKMAGVKVRKNGLVYRYMLWFNFILCLNFISLCKNTINFLDSLSVINNRISRNMHVYTSARLSYCVFLSVLWREYFFYFLKL